jgi:hypothetical protein
VQKAGSSGRDMYLHPTVNCGIELFIRVISGLQGPVPINIELPNSMEFSELAIILTLNSIEFGKFDVSWDGPQVGHPILTIKVSCY